MRDIHVLRIKSSRQLYDYRISVITFDVSAVSTTSWGILIRSIKCYCIRYPPRPIEYRQGINNYVSVSLCVPSLHQVYLPTCTLMIIDVSFSRRYQHQLSTLKQIQSLWEAKMRPKDCRPFFDIWIREAWTFRIDYDVFFSHCVP